ncbi:hypothetical protein GGX14DRAFT_578210 [Mycena pura]|uniref:Uncharacterized protein n=1 Tax=Mycena pura TaxID=153505 RepID=A0AAD6UXA2_9AGAR|nr:hypothetical protein GGX14DRAFT_578210 [Mycena pura]
MTVTRVTSTRWIYVHVLLLLPFSPPSFPPHPVHGVHTKTNVEISPQITNPAVAMTRGPRVARSRCPHARCPRSTIRHTLPVSPCADPLPSARRPPPAACCTRTRCPKPISYRRALPAARCMSSNSSSSSSACRRSPPSRYSPRRLPSAARAGFRGGSWRRGTCTFPRCATASPATAPPPGARLRLPQMRDGLPMRDHAPEDCPPGRTRHREPHHPPPCHLQQTRRRSRACPASAGATRAASPAHASTSTCTWSQLATRASPWASGTHGVRPATATSPRRTERRPSPAETSGRTTPPHTPPPSGHALDADANSDIASTTRPRPCCRSAPPNFAACALPSNPPSTPVCSIAPPLSINPVITHDQTHARCAMQAARARVARSTLPARTFPEIHCPPHTARVAARWTHAAQDTLPTACSPLRLRIAQGVSPPACCTQSAACACTAQDPPLAARCTCRLVPAVRWTRRACCPPPAARCTLLAMCACVA